MYTESLSKLINELKKMPSIGAKTAQRLAFYLLQISKSEANKLAQAIVDLKEKIGYCSRCGNITETDPCSICTDPARNSQILCVVEEPNDLLAIEKSRAYRGKYHVLMGVLSPLDNIGPEDLRIKELLQRIPKEGIQEVVIATGPTLEGEATAMYLAKQLKPLGIKVTRIARGLPMGGDLEYTDELTIAKSLEGRAEI